MDKHFDLFTTCVNQERIFNYSSPFFFGFLAKDGGAIHWVTEGTGQALFQGTEKSRPLYYYPSWYIYIYIYNYNSYINLKSNYIHDILKSSSSP